MYLATVQRPAAPTTTGAAPAGVPANVKALGAVSLVTDVSSEMVTAVLPLYAALFFALMKAPVRPQIARVAPSLNDPFD